MNNLSKEIEAVLKSMFAITKIIKPSKAVQLASVIAHPYSIDYIEKSIEINSRKIISSEASRPVIGRGARDTFQGNMSIEIADKGKNVESVKFSSIGGLDLGISGIGF